MNKLDDHWQELSYDQLLAQAVNLEVREAAPSAAGTAAGHAQPFMGASDALAAARAAETVLQRFTKITEAFMLIPQEVFEAFAAQCGRLPLLRQILCGEAAQWLMRAAWQRRHGSAGSSTGRSGLAQQLQQRLVRDAAVSWSYEGLNVRFDVPPEDAVRP